MQYTVLNSEFPGTTTAPAHSIAVFEAVLAAAAAGLQCDGISPNYTDSDRPREVARLITHALRISLLTGPHEAIPEWAYGRARASTARAGERPAIGLLHEDLATAIDSTDHSLRRTVGMSLISGLRGSASDPAARPVRVLGNWLIGQDPSLAAAGMARWMSHRLRPYQHDLGRAWWRIHGEHLISVLGSDHRLLDTALTRRWEAGGITIEGLAELTELSAGELEARLPPVTTGPLLPWP